MKQLLTIMLICICLLAGTAFAAKPGDLDNDGFITITDLISGLKAITGLSENITTDADVNGDNKIGLEEVIYIYQISAIGEPPNSFPTELEGYVWLFAASFINDSNKRSGKAINTIPITYPFAISITPENVVSTTIPGFDPTKGILRQNISEPGEIPGAKRLAAFLSLVIPKNTRFSYTKSANGDITLTSNPVIIAADDPRNPARRELRRTWKIEINNEAVLNGSTDHGKITEETQGFLPSSQKIVSNGTVYLAPFQPVKLSPVETP